MHGAFRATAYVVRPHPLIGGVKHVLRVDAAHPALDAALTAHGLGSWAFITAWNPRANPRPLHTNERLQRALHVLLEARGQPFVSAIGVADDRSWFEESVFVPGLSRDEALRIGRLFDQEAVVWSRVNGNAELLECLAFASP